MILIAVAVLLAGWGIYAMTRDDDNGAINSSSTLQPQQPPAQPVASAPAQPVSSAPAPEGSPAPEAAPSSAPAPADAPAPAPAPAPAGGNQPAAQPRVHVLNNSMVPGLAKDVADQLKGRGYELGEVGNYAEGVVPENTVYFTPDTAGAEQAARKLADSVGGIAVARVNNLPEETRDANTIVLVLAGETQIN